MNNAVIPGSVFFHHFGKKYKVLIIAEPLSRFKQIADRLKILLGKSLCFVSVMCIAMLDKIMQNTRLFSKIPSAFRKGKMPTRLVAANKMWIFETIAP